MKVLCGVEITHVPARRIDEVVSKARKLGAEIVVVHGETISEPVEKGTNLAAVLNPEVDILAHPGFITLEEAQMARDNGVALEITSRGSHCKTNGHVARMAQQSGAHMVIDSDAHAPGDLIDLATALQIALAAGLTREEADRALIETPKAMVKRRCLH
jgi:histidinol phosphatase-like PHP family hydrolase